MHVADEVGQDAERIKLAETVGVSRQHPHGVGDHLYDIVVPGELPICLPVVALCLRRDIDVMPSIVVAVALVLKKLHRSGIVGRPRRPPLDGIRPAGKFAKRIPDAERGSDAAHFLRRMIREITLRGRGNRLVARDRPELTCEQSSFRLPQGRTVNERCRAEAGYLSCRRAGRHERCRGPLLFLHEKHCGARCQRTVRPAQPYREG